MKKLKSILSLLIIISLIIQPIPVQAKSKIDIVFIIDRSGSMGGAINNVKNNVNQFVDLLQDQGIDYQLGLLSYEDDVTRYPMTSDVEVFKQKLSGIRVGGGTENGLDAIMNAINNYVYDVNSTKYFVLIGDEKIYSDDGYSQASVERALIDNNIILTTIGEDYIKDQFEGLSNATGGLYLDLNSNFSQNLTSIFEQIQTIPTLEIIAPTANQLFNGTSTLIPTINVLDPDSDTLKFNYYVNSETQPRDTRTVTNTKTAQLISFNTLNVGSLPEGNNTLRFTVDDGSATVQDTVVIRVDKTAPTLSTVQINTNDTSIGISGSASDATSGLHSLPYRYTVGSYESQWMTNTSHTKSNLTPNTAYTVKFEARDVVGNIRKVEESKYTKAQTPSFTVGNPKETTLDLSFNDANPAITQYQITVGGQYVTSLGALTTSPTWITLQGKQITIKGLSSNTAYSIQAKAKNQINEATLLSSNITGRTLATPPSNITATAAQRSVTVEWSAVAGVTSYEIEADGIIRDNGTATTYIHTGLAPNTTHSYRVRSKNGSGVGVWSSLINVATLPDPPPIPTNLRTVESQTEISISWDTIPVATAYDIEVDGKIIDNGNSTSYVHKGLSPITGHTYRVRAKNSGGISQWGELITTETLPYPPVTPKNISVQVTKTTATVEWESVEGATAYEIEVDGMILDNGNNTTYLHEGLEAYSGHSYRVRAKNAGGKSPWSNKIDVTTHPEKPEMPENVMTTADQDSISITWYDVPFAEDYEIEIDGSTIQTVVEPNFVHNGLSKNSTHSYRVRARNISGYSEWSNPVTMATMADDAVSLTNMVAVVTNNSIMLSWDAVAFEGEYEIEVDGVLLDNGKNTIYNHTGLEPNQYHTYKIKVKNGKSGQEWCAILSLSTLPNPPNAPVNIEATATNNTVELRWEKVEGATGYDVEVDGVTIDNGTNESYVHENLEPGTAHIYRVRAKNITGVTAWSPSLTQSTTTPTYYVSCIEGKEIDFSLLASNVQDFSELKFVVTYNPNEVEVVDLYGFSPKADTITEGQIEGTNIYVKHTSGRIEFTVNKNIVPGTSWSGEITSVIFKAKIDGQTSIDFLVE